VLFFAIAAGIFLFGTGSLSRARALQGPAQGSEHRRAGKFDWIFLTAIVAAPVASLL